VSKLEGFPLKLRVQATAGSGKTQLALDEIRVAKELGYRFLYVCFNRNLADDMKHASGVFDSCVTFNELAKKFSDELGIPSDFQDPMIFDRQVEALLSNIHVLNQQFDVLLIDEGQDFEPAWLEALIQLVAPTGRLLVLMDADQNLYDRSPYEFDGFVTLNHPISYRCPAESVALINHYNLSGQKLHSLSPLEGFETRLETYTGNLELLVATECAVQSLLDAGHEIRDIVVLSVKGEKSSVLMQQTFIGRFSVRKAIGRDSSGAYVYSEGELYVDTVFKFKGRSANCVVLSEVDFIEESDRVKRRLFVGITRARLELAVVVSNDSVYFLER
jgi:superfamily I DNA and RNA helicase